MKGRLLAHAVIFALLPGSLSGQRTLLTTDRLIFGNQSDLTASIVFEDVDGDGDLDALIANGRHWTQLNDCLLYTSTSPRDLSTSRMPSSA